MKMAEQCFAARGELQDPAESCVLAGAAGCMHGRSGTSTHGNWTNQILL